jgi:hypothetical protein
MPIKSVHCHVYQGNVTVVTDLEGRVERIICPEYEATTGTCRLRKAALRGGPLSQLLERVEETSLDSRATGCILA